MATARQPRRGRPRRIPPAAIRATRGPQPPDAVVRRLGDLVRRELAETLLPRVRALLASAPPGSAVGWVGPVLELPRLRTALAAAAVEVARNARREVHRVLSPERRERAAAAPPSPAWEYASYVQRVIGTVGDAGLTEAIAELLRKRLDAKDAHDPVAALVEDAAARAAAKIKLETQAFHARAVQTESRAAGLTAYVWTTQLDEKVRPGHSALEGSIQLWSERPITDAYTDRHAHPGEDANCRCIAFPWDDGDEEIIDPPAPPPPPVPKPKRPRKPRAPRRPAPPVPAPVVAPPPAPPPPRPAPPPRPTPAVPPPPAVAPPLPRPGRTFEERMATYAEKFVRKSGVTDAEMEAIVSAIEHVNVRGLRNFEVTTNLSANGLYFPGGPRARDMSVLARRDTSIHRPLPDRPKKKKLWSISTSGRTPEEMAKLTTYHELGHHVHLHGAFEPGGPAVSAFERIDKIIRARFDAKDREYLTDYAVHGKDYAEYFAEAHAVYFHRPDWLRRVAPKAYQMVEECLSIRRAAQ